MSLGYYAITHVVDHLQCLSLGLILTPLLSCSLKFSGFFMTNVLSIRSSHIAIYLQNQYQIV